MTDMSCGKYLKAMLPQWLPVLRAWVVSTPITGTNSMSLCVCDQIKVFGVGTCFGR